MQLAAIPYPISHTKPSSNKAAVISCGSERLNDIIPGYNCFCEICGSLDACIHNCFSNRLAYLTV